MTEAIEHPKSADRAEREGWKALSFLDRRTHGGAPPGYNRWLIPPAALAVHLCIGQAYATSVYKTSMVAHFETSLTAIGIVFSIAIVMLGLSAAVLGTWVDAQRAAEGHVHRGLLLGAGFLVGAAGIATSQLWLLYLGYGVIGGIGLGIGYISPVSTLIKWFPDRPGWPRGWRSWVSAAGRCWRARRRASSCRLYDPAYDPADSTSLAERAGTDACSSSRWGSTYFVIMMLGVATSGCRRRAGSPRASTRRTVKQKALVTTADVAASEAIRTPQFWLLWTVLFCNVTAGIGILEQASPMIQDFFRRDGTSTVAVAAAGGFVGLLSLFNMAGRFVWSSTSDVIGRKPMYMIYLGVGHGGLHAAGPGRQHAPPAFSCSSRRSPSRSTAAASPRCPPTCGTCSARSRSAPSTVGC